MVTSAFNIPNLFHIVSVLFIRTESSKVVLGVLTPVKQKGLRTSVMFEGQQLKCAPASQFELEGLMSCWNCSRCSHH